MAISTCDVHKNDQKKQINPYENISFPVACYEDDMQIISVPLHWHDEFEYIIAVKGKVTVNLNTDQLTLCHGDALFINSGCLHSVESVTEETSLLHSLVIQTGLIGGNTESIIYQKTILPFLSASAPAYLLLSADQQACADEVTGFMHSAWKAVTEETYDYENEARYLISKALHILADNMPVGAKSSSQKNILLSRMKVSLSYIEEHYMEDLGNQDLMLLCHCSESALLRSFRQTTGTTPAQYLLRFRIEKAIDMLLNTELKSCEIAAACGFRDNSYFTRIFKRFTGKTPLRYRQALQK